MDGRFFGPGWHGGFPLFGSLFGIVLFAVFIGLLVWALMRLMNHDHTRHAPVGGPWQARDDALNAGMHQQETILDACRVLRGANSLHHADQAFHTA